jgi:Glycosyl transferase family group 2
MSIARNGRPGRPSVSVVMPFAGSQDEGWAAIEVLGRLDVLDGDELLLADNAGVLASTGGGGLELRASTGVPVAIVRARREQSPAHARNAGAAAACAASEWILFLDADTVAPPDLLDRYFVAPIADDVGAVAGGIAAASLGRSAGIVARYGAHKNFLDAGAHLAHPFMPRAAAANLLVRRAAFDAVGGFFEGLRAAEDTDFSWRLQRAGWTLASRPAAAVEHQYRDSLRGLRRQWRGYAAGRAWLGRRYDGFAPQPAVLRAASARVRRAASGSSEAAVARRRPAEPGACDPAAAPPRSAEPGACDPAAAPPRSAEPGACDPAAAPPRSAGSGARDPAAAPPRPPGERLGDHHRQVKAISQAGSVPVRDRVQFAVLDAILGVEELVGFALSNRPPGTHPGEPGARCVLVAARFPDAETDASATADAAHACAGPVRIEAAARAERAAPPPAGVTVAYREDDGPLDRLRALATLVGLRLGPVLAMAVRDHDAPSPAALAPAACRLLDDPDATVGSSSTDPLVQATAQRLGRLAGRELPRGDGWRGMLMRRAHPSNRIPATDDHEPKERR